MRKLKAEIVRQIKRMEEALSKVELKESNGKELINLSRAYFNDSKHFLEQEKFIEAFEAVVISWAYIDAGLSLGVFKIPWELKGLFTID